MKIVVTSISSLQEDRAPRGGEGWEGEWKGGFLKDFRRKDKAGDLNVY